MATFDLGRVTPIYKGDYNAATSYELNDVVLHEGNLYWHHKPTATVGVFPTDTTVWGVVFTDEGVRAEIRGYADNAQASADSASASKTAAAQSASQASASASQAALSAQTAQTAETGATASAQTASTKASEATASAQSAASSAQTATDKATLASQKASEASASASTASEAKTAAITNAQLSVTKADEARSSATQAAVSATSAQEYDESAQQSAGNAQTSATNAAASEAAAKRYAEDSAAYLGAYPTDTAEGEIASFSDGADDVPVKSLVVGIEPVQDLHGYDNPWPAGGGVNLLDPNSVTVYSAPTYGMTMTWNADTGALHLSGTYTGGTSSRFQALNIPSALRAYAIKGFSESNIFNYMFWQDGEDRANIAFKNAVKGKAYDFDVYPVVYSGDTAPVEWTPYANICPITGWTGAKISKSGVNLWDEEWVVGTVSSVGVPYVLEGKIRSKNYIPVKQGTTLYFKCPSELRVAQYDASKTFISYTTVTNGTLTMTDKTCFVMFTMAKADETYDGDISINYSATDTAYHPYSGESIDISFPTEAGTVYGGSLDVTNGVLMVDRAKTVFAGGSTETWQMYTVGEGLTLFRNVQNDRALGNVFEMSNKFSCDTYKVQQSSIRTNLMLCGGGLNIDIVNNAFADVNSFKADLQQHNVTVVYPLATPVTYQLTPTEVKSLLGQNNIWADAGDTTVEYRADTSAYIAKKIAEAISALS